MSLGGFESPEKGYTAPALSLSLFPPLIRSRVFSRPRLYPVLLLYVLDPLAATAEAAAAESLCIVSSREIPKTLESLKVFPGPATRVPTAIAAPQRNRWEGKKKKETDLFLPSLFPTFRSYTQSGFKSHWGKATDRELGEL